MPLRELPVDPAPERLQLIKSPVQENEDVDADNPHLPASFRRLESGPLGHFGYKSGLKQSLMLMRNDDATNLEVFYDLFLACLNLFNQNQQMATLAGLSSYAGFFCLLWTTWLLTSLYDVRFVTDSVFERFCRAVHLGVLVGFVTVSPNFDPSDQEASVFRTFSLILMVSRLCLALEYSSILFHLRKYEKTKIPLAGMIFLNFATAMIYLGVSFRFSQGSSRLFYCWYPLAVGEIAITIAMSVFFPILGFQGTHLIRRLSLLTLIIFGEGITVASTGITSVIRRQGHEAWTPTMIGLVTVWIGAIYIVFMIYFDWMCHFHLPSWRQLTWALLHFPLHLALTLFMEGCAQFIVFWKVVEFAFEWIGDWNRMLTNRDFDNFVQPIREWVENFLKEYPVTYTYYNTTIYNALEEMEKINFTAMNQRLESNGWDPSSVEALQDPDYDTYIKTLYTMVFAVDNIVYSGYGIDFLQDEAESLAEDDDPTFNPDDHVDSLDFNYEVSFRTYRRFRAVFQYTFVCAGGFLALATFLYMISRTEKWTRWAKLRTCINLAIALGLGLVACVSQNIIHLLKFQFTPAILPTITGAFMVVLIMNHLPLDQYSFSWLSCGWMKRRRRSRGRGDGEKQPRPASPDQRSGTTRQDSDPEMNRAGRDADHEGYRSEGPTPPSWQERVP